MATNFDQKIVSYVDTNNGFHAFKPINLHATKEEWESQELNSYIPKDGEIIVYDKASEDGRDLIKVGDGKTKVGDLQFSGSQVSSVNGKTGIVNLNAKDVGADPAGAADDAFESAIEYIDEEIRVLQDGLEHPIDSVNGYTGEVWLGADDVGAPTIDEFQSLKEQKADTIQKKTGNVIFANNSAYLPMKGLKLFGKTKQFTTTGKNLLPNTVVTQTVNGVTFTVNEDGSLTANGTATDIINIYWNNVPVSTGKAYKLSGCPAGGSEASTYMLYAHGFGADVGSGMQFTATSDTVNIMLRIRSGVTASNLTFYPMLRLASITDSTYEPYTGGMAAPNPDYPQSLESVGESGAINTYVFGANLFNPKESYGNSVIYTVDNAGVITFDASNATGAKYLHLPVSKPYGTITLGVESTGLTTLYVQKFANDYTAQKISNFTHTTEANGFLEVLAVVSPGKIATIKIMANSGAVALPYEPYRELQTLTASAPNGLAGLPVSSGGNYTDASGQQWVCDEVDFARGVYVKRIGRFTANGTETWSGTQSLAYTDLHDAKRFEMDGMPHVWSERFKDICASYGTITNGTTSLYNNTSIHYPGQNWLYVKISDEVGAGSYIKEYFASNPTVFIYELATPIETPLSAEELTAYASLHTNKPNTTVLNDSDVEMELTYYTPTTAVQMVHSPADKGKILSIDQHGCVVLKEETKTTLNSLGVTVTAQELNYVDGVTGNVQTQLDGKVPTSRIINGKALSSDINLTAADVGATDTKNTAGATDTSSKIFLVGATSQAANPQTYSHDTVYVNADGRLVSKDYVIGDTIPSFKTGYKKKLSYTFPKETSKTYYVVLKKQTSFEEQKFYLNTYGDNTQYISLVTINARSYMGATIHGQTLRYNGSEITEIAVYKNTTSTHTHDVVLKVKSNAATTTSLTICSDGDFALDSTCISTTAPTGTKEASYVPTMTDTIFTTGDIYTGAATMRGNLLPYANKTFDIGSTDKLWNGVYAKTFIGNLNGNADTATKATQDASGNVITSTYATKDDIKNLTASDVGARPSTWTPSASDVGAVPDRTLSFNIPAGQYASVNFSGTTFATVSCRGWKSSLHCQFVYSGYGASAARQALGHITNGSDIQYGLNADDKPQGFTIYNPQNTGLDVYVDVQLGDKPTVELTSANKGTLAVHQSVYSVNSKTGAVSLTYSDVGAEMSHAVGTYNGNGSSQTIDTGDSSSQFCIVRKSGSSYTILVSGSGFFGKNGNSFVANDSCVFSGGKLTLAYGDDLYNASGGKYYYQAL